MAAPYLISPLIDDGHIDVVNEHRHLLASGGPVGCTHPLVHKALNGSLATSTVHSVSLSERRPIREPTEQYYQFVPTSGLSKEPVPAQVYS